MGLYHTGRYERGAKDPPDFCTIVYTGNEEYLKTIAAGEFGGLMCRTMKSEELLNLTTILQNNSKVPFLIAGNMEAGMNQCCETGTRVGCPMAIAAIGEVKYAAELGRIIGEEANATDLAFGVESRVTAVADRLRWKASR